MGERTFQRGHRVNVYNDSRFICEGRIESFCAEERDEEFYYDVRVTWPEPFAGRLFEHVSELKLADHPEADHAT